MTSIFATNQFLIIGLFLLALVGLMMLVRRFKDPIASQLGGQRRIRLIEDTSIGAGDRIKLVMIDQVPYAIVTSKGQQPVVITLEEAATAAGKSAAASKPATPAGPPAAPDTANETAALQQPFLQAMKKARLRNPLLGLDK